jgi:hypothetical protein
MLSNFNCFVVLYYGYASESNYRSAIEGIRNVGIPHYLQGNFSIRCNYKNKFLIKLAANNIGKKYSDPDESTNIDVFGPLGMIQPSETFLLSIKYTLK